MKAASLRHVWFLSIAFTLVALGGCADVHKNPASNVVNGQADTAAQQSADAPPVRQSSVAF
jgi:hypothetical protein